jgi:Trm5-related predicted tRNA methylase
MNKNVKIYNTSIKKSYLDTFEKILNQVILNNDEENDILNNCNTTYYIYLLGLIVDEKNRTENKFYSILDDIDVILKDFDIEDFFKTKRNKIKYYMNPDNPGPIDPLRIDFDF